jgi:hypothetical protein
MSRRLRVSPGESDWKQNEMRGLFKVKAARKRPERERLEVEMEEGDMK